MAVRKSPKGKQTNLRHVWLASLGAVAVARRGASGAVGGACRPRGGGAGAAGAAAAGARDGPLEARGRAREALAPVMERVGRAPNKPATRKPPRRAARKPASARKSAPRSAAARKQAERRVAGRGR